MQLELHPIQAKILTKLLFYPICRFTDLNVDGIDSDRFNFHIKRLIELNVITKTDQGLYDLTTSGKELANRFDTDTHEIERQAKVAILIVGILIQDNIKRHLIQKRLKQPYYGYYGFVTGKIKWGETIFEAGLRELYEETALEGDLKLVGIEHKMDYNENNKILEDKYFFILKAENIVGELAETFEGGENLWLTRDEIESLPDLFSDVLSILDMIERPGIDFEEIRFTVDKY